MRLYDMVSGDDMDFYEKYLMELTDEEIEEFFDENPDFMKSFQITKERIPLLRDEKYRGILRRISK